MALQMQGDCLRHLLFHALLSAIGSEKKHENHRSNVDSLTGWPVAKEPVKIANR